MSDPIKNIQRLIKKVGVKNKSVYNIGSDFDGYITMDLLGERQKIKIKMYKKQQENIIECVLLGMDINIGGFDYNRKYDKNIAIMGGLLKDDKYTGTKKLLIYESFLKSIQVSKSVLSDGSSVDCKSEKRKGDTNLTFFLLMKDGITWYERRGYKLSDYNILPYLHFNNKKDAKKHLKESLKLLRNYRMSKIKYHLLKVNKLLKKSKGVDSIYPNRLYDNKDYETVYNKNKQEQVISNLEKNKVVLDLFNKYKFNKNTTFCEYIVGIYNIDCGDYQRLVDNLFTDINNNMLFNVRDIDNKHFITSGTKVINELCVLFRTVSYYFNNGNIYTKQIR